MDQVIDFQGEEPSLRLRVRSCMEKRNIRSVAALNRKLREAGVEISHQQLSRVVNNETQHLNIPLLNAMVRVLQCRVDELFALVPTHA
ncbi:helix-turn-helix domain-containing protein [Ralstonia pseudosolanacearum]|uniref:helix-turn-helix domain-containing protein n=1 Tax=Ralstonia pseudosolanacearum TaxID=1310165 RepID=UPI003CF25566